MKGTISLLLLVATLLCDQGCGEDRHRTQTETVHATTDTRIIWLMYIVARLTDLFVKLTQISKARSHRRL